MKNIILVFVALFTTALFAQTIPPRIKNAAFYHSTSAGLTVAEASDFTAVADTAGSLSGTYFYFYDTGDAHCYQPWYNVDSVGVAPTAITGCTLVPVVIATGDTDSTVAGNTRTALNTAPYSTYFAITGATTHVIVTSLTKGSASDGNIGTSGFSVSKTQGVSSIVSIASASVLGDVVMWKICNDAVNTSTELFVGKAQDTESDGVALDKGACFVCVDCSGAALKLMRVSAQAASNGYSVIQYQKQ
jgi:hypothetical protein